MPLKKNKSILDHIPTIGIFIFVVLYIYSSTRYPGGSQADLSTDGFDWINNYWCNLMNPNAMNEQINPARPFAISAMIILCFALMIFFIRFAEVFSRRLIWKRIIQINGVLSMFFAALIFTQFHDLMTILSSVFGAAVVIGIIRELYLSKLILYKVSGFFCLLLLGMNNYIYYTEQLLYTLPLLQKITFATVLFWIFLLNVKMNRLSNKGI
jgi:hypothetical protein